MTGAPWMLLGFFAFVMALVTAAGYLFLFRSAAEAGGHDGGLPGAAGETDFPLPQALLLRIFERVGRAVPVSRAETAALRKRLISAGYRSPSAVPLLYGVRCAGGALLAIVAGWGVFVVQDSLTAALAPAICAAAFGFLLPDGILRSMVQARAGRIRRALPDALDLMVLCVEAGQSLDQALIDASSELKRACPDLSAELSLTHLEVRAGTSRADALRNLASRVPAPELRKLVNLLIQADRFGSSLGPSLRVHARHLRTRSRQKAEESARKISVKLLFPIFFLIFPSILMVSAGPAILEIFTQLLPMIGSQ